MHQQSNGEQRWQVRGERLDDRIAGRDLADVDERGVDVRIGRERIEERAGIHAAMLPAPGRTSGPRGTTVPRRRSQPRVVEHDEVERLGRTGR